MKPVLKKRRTTDGIVALHPTGWRGLLFFEGGNVKWFLRWAYFCIQFRKILPYSYGCVGVGSSYRVEVLDQEKLREIEKGEVVP